jgi:hypothetical protein
MRRLSVRVQPNRLQAKSPHSFTSHVRFVALTSQPAPRSLRPPKVAIAQHGARTCTPPMRHRHKATANKSRLP